MAHSYHAYRQIYRACTGDNVVPKLFFQPQPKSQPSTNDFSSSDNHPSESIKANITYISNHNPYEFKRMSPFYVRPYSIYKGVMDRIAKEEVSTKVNGEKPFRNVLDIGCGTGISCQALTAIADKVTGIDPSVSMIEEADKSNPFVSYQLAVAERLPFADKVFDLVTFSVSFHWVDDQKKALSEAARVLSDNGKLVIYYTGFTGIESNEYKGWIKNCLHSKYPPVKAKRSYISEDLKTDQFPLVLEDKYIEYTQVSSSELADLLMTMSGVFDTADKNNEQPRDIKDWIMNELTPFYATQEKQEARVEKRSFRWDMSIWSMKKQSTLKLPPDPTIENVSIDNIATERKSALVLKR